MTAEQDQLLCRYLDGRLSPEDKDALQDLLRSSAVARRRLRMLAAVTEGISSGEVIARASTAKSTILATPNKLLLAPIIPWGIAAAACIVAMLAWFDGAPYGQQGTTATTTATTSGTTSGGNKVNNTVNQTDSLVALLVDEAGAEFSDGKAPDEVRFNKGSYQLQRGAVHLRFANGTDMVMNAPASFDIDDAFHVRLHQGDMRAIVPPSGEGFTIVTAGIDYEDRGTEFAVSVDPDKGLNALHVINGQVDAKAPGSDTLISSVTGGQSVQFADGELGQADAPDMSRYPSPGSIGFLRWQQQRSNFSRNDPDLIAYYPFTQSSQLRNEADSAIAGDGEIHGARWVSGRWPGKHALLFDRDTDFVELNIPGKYRQLSFAAWVKLEGFDHSHNALFNSNGWEPGDVHWTIHRHGTMALSYHGGNITKTDVLKPVPTNEWVHLAATLCQESGKSLTYVNGELAVTSDIIAKGFIRPGTGRIGNWLMGDRQDPAPLRALRGRMDELAIWKRALTKDEIEQLTKQGRPSALWPMAGR